MGRDTLSVWKRSVTCPLMVEADDDEEEGEEGEEGEDGEGDEGGDEDEEEVGLGVRGGGGEVEVQWWRHIPEHERMPIDAAAPCVAHLLE